MKKLLYGVVILATLFLAGCADAGKDQKVSSQESVTLDGSQSTPDYFGNIEGYAWKQVDLKRKKNKNLKVKLTGKHTATPSFVAPDVDKTTTLRFRLVTTEKGGVLSPWHSRDSVNVIVSPYVTDTTLPVITLHGEGNMTLEQNANYTELGATALDAVDGNVSVNISGNVDTATVGTYTMTYTATDKAGNTATLTRTVNVVLPPDTTPPVITLNGEVSVTLTQGSSYTEAGATAIDERDGDVNVTIEGSVDTSVEGTYSITYRATDKAGNVVTATRTVIVITPTLASLSLESNVTTLNVGETAELTVMGTYSDGSTSELDTNIEYIITPSDSVEMNGTVLTAKRDSNVTVQAKVNGVLSNTINLTIAWVVNGHVLPPEPDKTLNDSTLLGIDVNDNGVRDDVERWIYEEYKDKHPIHIDIGMQTGRAYKLVLESPERAKEIYPIIDAPLYCKMYYTRCSEGKNYNFIENMDSRYFRKNIYFNSIARKDIYAQYDKLLSGDSYTLIRCSRQKQLCDFNTTKYEK